jgi:hypothetical protein
MSLSLLKITCVGRTPLCALGLYCSVFLFAPFPPVWSFEEINVKDSYAEPNSDIADSSQSGLTLPLLLTQKGFHQIPLSKNGVGHFQIEASLNGRAISLLIDTGAESCGGARTPHPYDEDADNGWDAGGVGLDLFELHDVSMTLNQMVVDLAMLIAMDLAQVNQALIQQGAQL